MAHDSIRTHDTRCPCDRCMRIRVDLAQPPTWSNFRLLPDTGLHEDNIVFTPASSQPATWVRQLARFDRIDSGMTSIRPDGTLAHTSSSRAKMPSLAADWMTFSLDAIDDPDTAISWPDRRVTEPTWDDIGMGAIANQPYDGRQANTDDMRVERWSRVVDRPDAERFVSNHNALEQQQKALRTLGYSGADLIEWETDVSQRLGATGYSFEQSFVPQGKEAFEALDEVQRFLLRTGARILAGGILVPLPLPPRAFTTFERPSDRPYLAASALSFTDPDSNDTRFQRLLDTAVQAEIEALRVQYRQAQFGRDVTPGTPVPNPTPWPMFNPGYSSDAGNLWMLKVYTPAIIRPSAREWNVLRANIGLPPLSEE